MCFELRSKNSLQFFFIQWISGIVLKNVWRERTLETVYIIIIIIIMKLGTITWKAWWMIQSSTLKMLLNAVPFD